MKYTLADFKRKAQVGAKIRGCFLYRLKDNQKIEDLPYRTITKVQSNGVKLDGSFLDFPKANACEFDGKTLKIFETGWRKLTTQEKEALAKWEEIKNQPENKKQCEIDIMTDTNIMYYKAKKFFADCNMSHLFERTPTKYLDKNKYSKKEEYCVRDNKASHGALEAIYQFE